SPATRRVLTRLTAFDGVASAGSVAALSHFFWRTALWASLTADEKTELAVRLGDSPNVDLVLDAKAIQAVEQASAAMLDALGSVDRAYGDYFRVSRDGVQSWPVGGGPPLAMQDYSQCLPLEKAPPYVCALTQRAMAFRGSLADGRLRLTEGSRALRLVVFGEPLQTYSLHNYGQSDDPQSVHFTDQARLLTSPRALKQVPYTLDELAQVVTSTRVLTRRRP
ncbi:MAG: penicillin acylase family protein, partial [Phycisphaerae bacterium]|nr:penicillin acylase family protein [Phycisphaerae bacterium]